MNKLVGSVVLVACSVTAARADTEATVDIVVTPNTPVVITPDGAAQPLQPPGLPPPTVAAAPAPQNEDWNNVSHINGVPVKYGERGDYLIKHKTTNISANPFGLFFGLYDVAATHALSQNFAISGALTAMDEFTQISATVPLFFKRVFSGPFLEGGLLYRSEGDGEEWAGPQLLLGWQWTFDSGLNLAVAGGLAKRMNNEDEYSDGTEGNAYFRVGYAF